MGTFLWKIKFWLCWFFDHCI